MNVDLWVNWVTYLPTHTPIKDKYFDDSYIASHHYFHIYHHHHYHRHSHDANNDHTII